MVEECQGKDMTSDREETQEMKGTEGGRKGKEGKGDKDKSKG